MEENTRHWTTLEEAITYCQTVVMTSDDKNSVEDYLQLSQWLSELKGYRKELRNLTSDISGTLDKLKGHIKRLEN